MEIQINKDIGAFAPKLVGPFTARQTISMAIAAPICYGIYSLAVPLGLQKDVVGFLVLIPAGLGFLFGWYKPYGIPLERFLKTAFISAFVAPTYRKYVTVNTVPLDNETVDIKTETPKGKKTKYIPSPEAVR